MRARTVHFERKQIPKKAMDIGATNEDKLASLLQAVTNPLKDELNYHLNDVEHEDIGEPYTIVDAFDDASSIVDFPCGQILRRQCRDIYIAVGYAIPMKDDTSGYWFKQDGIYYDANGNWLDFLKKKYESTD